MNEDLDKEIQFYTKTFLNMLLYVGKTDIEVDHVQLWPV